MRDTITFIEGRLNSDVDIALMPKGDSPVDTSEQDSGRLNIAHLDGNLGVLSNLKGTTTLATLGTLLASVYDHENNAIIMLVYGTVYNRVMRFNNDGSYTTIYSEASGGPSLGLSSSEMVRRLQLIGSGDDKQLFWISTDNNPRCMNIAEIIANPTTTPIDLALDSPITLPTLTLGSSPSIASNNIYNKGYQFAIKYVYFDGKESSWSDYIEPFYPSSIYEGFNGVHNNNITAYNKITITHSSIPNGVTYVKIAYRVVDSGSGSAGTWYLYDYVAVSASAISYNFYDNKLKSSVDSTDIAAQFYDVPLYGSDIEILKDNKLAISDPVLGYDNVSIQLSLETLYDIYFLTGGFASETSTGIAGTSDISIDVSSANVTQMFFIIQDAGVSAQSYYIAINIGDTSDDYAYQLVKAVNESPLSVGVIASRVSSNTVRFASGPSYDTTISQQRMQNSRTRFKSQKAGATHYFALAYTYDTKNRKGGANISTTSIISIPWWPDLNTGVTVDRYSLAVGFEISHLAPVGAVAWELLYAGSNIEYYYQLPVICNSEAAAVTADISYDSGYILIDVEAADDRILSYNDKFSSLISFNAAKGDRVRFKAKIDREDYLDANGRVSDWMTIFTNTIDLEIVDVDANGVLKLESNVTDAASNELFDILGDATVDVILIEVYRVSKDVSEENLVYKSIGQKGTVVTRYHQYTAESGTWTKDSDGLSFTSRNQTDVLSCRGVAICDGFQVMGLMYPLYNDADETDITVLMAILESQSISLSYASKYQTGKINYSDTEIQQRTIRGVSYGGSYSEDGLRFNELNKFLNEPVPVEDSHGPVYAMELIGYTLTIWQRSKVTAIYNTVEEISNQDKSSSLVTINNVLGNTRPYNDIYGTVFAKSVVRKDGYVYYYDPYNFVPVRKASNGNQEITYGMANFFKVRSKALLVSGIDNIDVYAVYDYILDMYILTVKDTVTSSNSFTIGFCEANSRWGNTKPGWYSFFSYMPDGYINMSRNRLFAFKNSALQEHHVSGTRNNFYGTQYSSYVTFVCNSNLVYKKYLRIATDSNDVWEAYEDDSIITGEDSINFEDADSYIVHTKKQQSRLRESEDIWKFERNMFRAAFRRNMLTNQGTADVYDLVTGDPLMGKYMKIKLRNTNTVDTNIKMVEVDYKVLENG